MSSTDLMGGYAAYTTPNAALQDLATAGAVEDVQKSIITITISITVSITVTIDSE